MKSAKVVNHLICTIQIIPKKKLPITAKIATTGNFILKELLNHEKNIVKMPIRTLILTISITISITIYCADLEKVIMLPRLEMFKSAIFTHRLSVYNESFVPVGKKQKNCKPFAAVWHDALLGRNKEQIISTFYNFFKSKRDVTKITLWLDNCTAQNKNWAFFSFLIFVVNSDDIRAEEIELKYFEPGHTFMAADSFHHNVELAMKRMGKVYDFEDFVQAVRNASRGTEVLPMKIENFFNWEDYSSQYKLNRLNPRPFIQSMTQVNVCRGSYTMKYKTDLDGEYFEINFLNSKITKNLKLPGPKTCSKINGISKEKKKNIIQNMGEIMRNRLHFWENLPTTD
ncbi:hypothetical protein ABEB36_012748 [Hypothenemus hampei]|uniref:DUF7869 domain-containing protein n=1 Tax=Hypothenemus hampei TaxID=57062 RepID=A0ABD1EC98_HYPHA